MTGRLRAVFACCMLATTCGCVTPTQPTPDAPTSYASYVGDRGRASFDEVVVSLPLRGAKAPYHHLHVGLAAFVNPVQQSNASPSDAQAIANRAEGRITARLVAVLGSMGEQSLDGTDALRRRITDEAQAVVDNAMKQWKHHADYRVEIAVVRLYWTDPSAVAPVQQLRFPWQ